MGKSVRGMRPLWHDIVIYRAQAQEPQLSYQKQVNKQASKETNKRILKMF